MKDLIFSVFPSENFVDLGLYQFGWGAMQAGTFLWPSCPQSLFVPLYYVRNWQIDDNR